MQLFEQHSHPLNYGFYLALTISSHVVLSYALWGSPFLTTRYLKQHSFLHTTFCWLKTNQMSIGITKCHLGKKYVPWTITIGVEKSDLQYKCFFLIYEVINMYRYVRERESWLVCKMVFYAFAISEMIFMFSSTV